MHRYKIFLGDFNIIEEKKEKINNIISNSNADIIFFPIRNINGAFLGDTNLYTELERNEFLKLEAKQRRYYVGYVKNEFYQDMSALELLLRDKRIKSIGYSNVVISTYNTKLSYSKKALFFYKFNLITQLYTRLKNKVKYKIDKNRRIKIQKIKDNTLDYSNFLMISDGLFHAQDNGEVFARFLKDIGFTNYRFVIDKNSPDYMRLYEEGILVTDCFSYEHKALILNAKYILTSYWNNEYFNAFKGSDITFAKSISSYEKIFLEHGITYNDHSEYINENNKKVDVSKYVCGAKKEYEILKTTTNIEYVFTGLPRHDWFLENKENLDKVFIFFTWRKWLEDGNVVDIEFHTKKIEELLFSNCIKEIAKDNKVTLMFHKAYKDILKHINIPEYINLISFENGNIQFELAKSKLIITDYSSILFEAILMKKALITYQFDQERFFNNHYIELINLEKLGLINPTKNIEEIELNVNNIIETNYKIPYELDYKYEQFYGITNGENCQRLYNLLKLDEL